MNNKSVMVKVGTQTEVKDGYDDHGIVNEDVQTMHGCKSLAPGPRKASRRNIPAMSNGLDNSPISITTNKQSSTIGCVTSYI